MNDHDYMRLALDLAEKGCGLVSPNPMVGAVIVKGNKIIGKGWHEKFGGLHAERNALQSCTESPKGATMYVTLEPCCHYGKQPPCVEAIIASGIRRVVIGSPDPNPLVCGKGVQQLREHSVLVTEHILQESCDCMNEVFFSYIQTKKPFVVMKYAMTMDGKIAAYTGASQWITGETARNHVQEQRPKFTAIMVGVGTILADDPLLTCRIPDSKNPIRIICDSNLRTPFHAKAVSTAKETPTILATCCTDRDKRKLYENAGCRIILTDQKDHRIDLEELMIKLGQEQIDSILLEGGGTLNWAALNSGIVQKTQAYVAPKIFGGKTAKTPVEGIGVASPAGAFRLKNSTVTMLGEDFLIESEVEYCVHGNH